MHLFIFNRGLRIQDNTTLNAMPKPVVCAFVFTEQVSQNTYKSNAAVSFMVESLHELAADIARRGGQLHFFHGEIIAILRAIHKHAPIATLGTNFDYTPYARERQAKFAEFCTVNKINFVCKEDHVLFDVLDARTKKADGSHYTVFSPFAAHVRLLDVRRPSTAKLTFGTIAHKIPSAFALADAKQFYKPDNGHGGRSRALAILHRIQDFAEYSKSRDYFLYPTTRLGPHNHFNTVSIREVYWAIRDGLKKRGDGLINELVWRDFYYQLYYYVPHMLAGQVGGVNSAFRPKYNLIRWIDDAPLFKRWMTGTTGIPVCDAAMRDLNQTGFMPNRLRMITAGVLTKLFLISWQHGEWYFARQLRDYDAIQNSAGWAWTVTGIDPQQVFRIFSPAIQGKKFDPECKYILRYIPELASVPIKDIHAWDSAWAKYPGVKYPKPAIEHHVAYQRAMKEMLRVHRAPSRASAPGRASASQ
jgi:deoxyribodipyrimidine photo-lyase